VELSPRKISHDLIEWRSRLEGPDGPTPAPSSYVLMLQTWEHVGEHAADMGTRGGNMLMVSASSSCVFGKGQDLVVQEGEGSHISPRNRTRGAGRGMARNGRIVFVDSNLFAHNYCPVLRNHD